MPDSLMTQIMSGFDTLSSKETIEAEISLHKQKNEYAFDELIRYYKADTINPFVSHDSLMNLLSKKRTLSAQYMLAFEYSHVGDWNSADNVLNSISTNYQLSSGESKQYEDYLQYFSFLKTLFNQGRTIYQLNQGDINTIHQLINSSSEPVRSYTENILEANNLLKYYEPIILPQDQKSERISHIVNNEPSTNSDWLHLFPNPARQYVIVDYNLTVEFSKQKKSVFLLVYSSDTRLIEKRSLIRAQDQILVNTSNYLPGVFLFSIEVGGKILKTKKIIISN